MAAFAARTQQPDELRRRFSKKPPPRRDSEEAVRGRDDLGWTEPRRLRSRSIAPEPSASRAEQGSGTAMGFEAEGVLLATENAVACDLVGIVDVVAKLFEAQLQ